MILKDNIDEVLDIRSWVYDLGSCQFLKHLYPLGYTKLRGEEVMPNNKEEENELVRKIIDLDSRHGFVYPSFQTPDHFSYDARRFMNNCISQNKFPFRMFAHEIGGVYHSSQIVPKKFGFGSDIVISVFDSDGNIDMKEYFNKIWDCLQNE